ncbi:glycosyltransferase [Cronbergia sp. UHCC 0137]|uniref:glycosyltransferase family 2 protein n=1 Tax=Cronbergia sp. UHCC 0137 TaxID=3110239 RepID=UPI002B1EEBF3|nr:glycosyltransferase [Cronbergia sp. UHCC 0137]MEA5619327.1 glycosyltransferase [Cronbergia sp. UHCC 0137]
MLTFSIIIPTYNRPERLKTCLDSLTRLNYPCDRFEVIIVDDGSDRPLDILVKSYDNEIELNLIRQANAGPATARNTGAKVAKGQYLAFTDDDCTPEPNWLLALENGFLETPNGLLGGKTINALPNNLYSTASQLLIDYLYNYYNIDSYEAKFFASNNFAVSRELFNQVGQFDITFPLAAGEDREFCHRWLYQDNKMIYIPEVTIYHAHKLTLKTFCLQHFNYGRGAFCFHQTRITGTNEPIKVEPLKFYLNLLNYPFMQQSTQPGMLITILFLISQIANVVGFFWEQWHQSAKRF